jgi:HlyD family secretion protein
MQMSKPVLVSTIAIIIILGATGYFYSSLKHTPAVAFTEVKTATITQAVNETGQVSASQDLSLAFEQGGTVEQVDVQAGDSVKQGQTLVKLDTTDAAAAVSQAAAALDAARANYQKLVNGATSANIQVDQAAVASAQTALNNAQDNLTSVTAQQNLIVKNAAAVLLNSNLAAMPSPNNVSTSNPSISGNYTDTTQGQYKITIYNSGGGYRFNVSGLETSEGQVSTAPVALGSKGLFIQFPNTNVYPNDTWTISLPNTQGTNYLTNLNAYNNALQSQNQAVVTAQSAVNSAQAALTQAQDNLQAMQTPARPEDIASANAQVEEAAAALQTTQDALSKSVLTAPIDGVITSVDTKVGETVAGSSLAPGPDAIKMISAQKFQIISYLSETDIGKIKVGDSASTTLDAYGSGVNFDATVISIDPSATVTNGISTYKTTLQFDQNDERIKEGMNANIIITDQEHQNALVIPQTAVIQNNNQDFVLLDSGNGKIVETPIQTGISDLNGNIEVTSGLSAGQMIAAFGNQ